MCATFSLFLSTYLFSKYEHVLSHAYMIIESNIYIYTINGCWKITMQEQDSCYGYTCQTPYWNHATLHIKYIWDKFSLHGPKSVTSLLATNQQNFVQGSQRFIIQVHFRRPFVGDFWAKKPSIQDRIRQRSLLKALLIPPLVIKWAETGFDLSVLEEI